MPASLKVLFIFLCIGLGVSLITLPLVWKTGYFLFGFHLIDLWSVLTTFFLGVVAVVLFLVVLLKRLSWAWLYGLGYFIFNIALILSSIFTLEHQLLAQPDFSQLPQVAQSMASAITLVGFILSIGVQVTFLVFIILRRRYFDGEKK